MTVKRTRVPMLRAKQVPRISFGFCLAKKEVARADPMVCPTYTIEPKAPKSEFWIWSSCLMSVEPAGRMPMSTLMKRLAKNCTSTQIVIHLRS